MSTSYNASAVIPTVAAGRSPRRYISRSDSRFDAQPSAKAETIKFNTARIDMLAIGIALTLAMLIRFNVIPGVSF